MKNEIERKFFVKELPDLSGIEPIKYERYFLEKGKEKEVRISKVGDKYFFEEKENISELERTRKKKEISKEEFEKFRGNNSQGIVRDKYNLSENPNISLQIYHGKFEGLIRAEVEFNSIEEAELFEPLPWMGKEITSLPISRDSQLTDLIDEEFKKYLI